MAIHWFPGHMNKARKKIAEAMPEIDLVIEVLDARLPFSSTNPLVDELRGDKPCIKLLNKSDLADPNTTDAWVHYFEQQHQVRALPLVAEQKSQVKRVIQLCKQLGQHRLERKRPIRIMIMGIPNVGKSTLINALAGRQVAKTGNEPAVTKANQMIDLKNGLVLSDTPGILWPKLEPESCGYRLAASGAVKDTAIEYQDVAQFALQFLLQHYPQALQQRFKLADLPESAELALEAISRKRGGLRPGGLVDLHKGAEVCLHELRAGKIGKISLESPAMVEQEMAELAALQAAMAESQNEPE
ncbi:ribosome biogenesis GTPase YlqF [Bacterioplanes sanyensis]|uniref:Ribosome biogenesis GTPase A n=1 Tax=Bacterioplanes sanyensis TaxID=1249553 RepID=A0A222FL40_9GAMM|nr:ribosome biogenesis GTPase YlqF [Bacterioplanes sanyensis]ASP39382.1 ribosome biogenesis GTPase YlqF [Bacterioplanes sanyensis]